MSKQFLKAPTSLQLEQKTLRAVIKEDGQYYIENKEEVTKLHITIEKDCQVMLVISLHGDVVDVSQHIDIQQGAQVNIVYKNDCSTYTSKETFSIYENAFLQCGYFSLHEEKCDIQALFELKQAEAKVRVISTVLANTHKKMNILCQHLVNNTKSNIENYGICLEDGYYEMEASGQIMKRAKGSKSHQSTRVLTLGSKEHVKVTPLLLIDENDVEASHACSIGEMNEDHLYYLETRGLNKQQALGLLTLSYILPILKLVEDNEEVKQAFRDEIENKVGLTC